MGEAGPGLDARSLIPRPVVSHSDPKVDFRDRGGPAQESRSRPRGVQGGGREGRLHPPSTALQSPASPALCRSLSDPAQLVHCLLSSDLPGAVSMLTFRLPTCHHLSQAIRLMAQGFPPRFWAEWGAEGNVLPMGVGSQGRHMG